MHKIYSRFRYSTALGYKINSYNDPNAVAEVVYIIEVLPEKSKKIIGYYYDTDKEWSWKLSSTYAGSYEIPDLTELSEEELFQYEVVRDNDYSTEFLKGIQEYHISKIDSIKEALDKSYRGESGSIIFCEDGTFDSIMCSDSKFGVNFG